MNRLHKMLIAVAILTIGVAALAPAPNAGSEHFVITNDNDLQGYNRGTVLELAGRGENVALKQVSSMGTGVFSQLGTGTPSIQMVQSGADVCVFLANGTYDTANEISAFKYPGARRVGNYTGYSAENNVQSLTAAGGYLYAYYYYGSIASWAIGSGCALNLVQTYSLNDPLPVQISGMATTPDGKTLVLSEQSGSGCCVDSFAIGPNGTLTEKGPYLVNATYPLGLDITADSQYAILGGTPDCPNCTAYVMAIAINSDGSLGAEHDFGQSGGLGNAPPIAYVRLSPDEKYLYTSTGFDDIGQVATLNFTENPLNITYGGCTITLKAPDGTIFARSLATANTSGAGSSLYVGEDILDGGSGVGLLMVNPATGCATEATSSPFVLSDPDGSDISSLTAWPPRPF
jgi:hypothetical protein